MRIASVNTLVALMLLASSASSPRLQRRRSILSADPLAAAFKILTEPTGQSLSTSGDSAAAAIDHQV